MPLAIAVILPVQSRHWHAELIHRLSHSGHQLRVSFAGNTASGALDAILAFEAFRFGPGLASRATVNPVEGKSPPSLVIDLTGTAPSGDTPTLSVLFDSHPTLDGTARAILTGAQPVVQTLLNGQPIGNARPMVSERIWLTRALDDILIRTLDLLERSVRDIAAGRTATLQPLAAAKSPTALTAAYWLGIAPKLAHRLFLKLRYKPFHWRVGYRFHPEPLAGLGFDMTATGYATLSAPQWQELPEDGSRFYADPFPVEVDGRYFLFVEDFPHATHKGVIAVAEADGDGTFGVPRVVLEEPFHLSYPQVFQHDGAFWMIPETAGGRDLYLYRAENFPDRWVRHAVLVADTPLSDATLLHHGDRFWLFAADGGRGSSSDSMLVFHAETLSGPFLPHAANPILIDQASARPAGAFILGGQYPMLPVQDGTHGYGSGMGLVEITELNLDRVGVGPVRPLDVPGWRCEFRHTTNRAGRLEVVDGVVRQPR
ncbi:MAG: hypothetical protein JWR51_4099 [Devosia sp.]|uniref:glucosamine inositolphosphorylceramide transferase family protein n=1 Tax=Devosia sp. TaxID=1871048 RepID=UPI0026142594|nr:hypothetical protein [Devosia sp.]MDB5530996.1 hypothetical protein [Devosia sp.]